MLHAHDGALRRLLDEEWAVPEPLRRHVAECDLCQARLSELRQLRDETARLLASPDMAHDVHAALRRQRELQARDLPARTSLPQRWPRNSVRWAAGLAGFAAILALLTTTPVGGFARSLLLIFQPVRFTAVPVTPAQTRSLLDLVTVRQSSAKGEKARIGLASLGVVRTSGAQRLVPAQNLQALDAAVGFQAAVPADVPPGIGSASYASLGQVMQSVTLDPQAIEDYARGHHLQIPAMPAGMAGSVLSVTTGPAALVTYGVPAADLMSSRSMPALVVAQAPVPKVFSTGATTQEIESYVLSLPGISSQLSAEIRAVGDVTETLPIPVPTGSARSQPVTIGSAQGLYLQEVDGAAGAVVWTSDGYVHLVAGALDRSQLLQVAGSLH